MTSEDPPTAPARPLVAAAMICQQVLEEANGVLSAIRMVDTFTSNEIPPGLPHDVGSPPQSPFW